MAEEGEDPLSSSTGGPSVPVDMGDFVTRLFQAMQGNQGDPFAKRNKEFGSLGAKKFDGKGNYLDADAWLQQCEHIFQRMQLTEVQKQQLASHQLEGRALGWWRSIEKDLDLNILTWEEFRTRFKEHFLPYAAELELAEQFNKLTQGCMSVTDYANRFNELSRYAPHLIDTPRRKNEKFINGLNFFISKALLFAEGEPFDRLVGMALRFESKDKEYKEIRGKMKSGDISKGSRSYHEHKDKGRFKPYDPKHKPNHEERFQPHKGDSKAPKDSIFSGKTSLAGHAPSLVPNRPYLTAIPDATRRAPGPGPTPNVLTCWNCHRPGHKYRDCPSKDPKGKSFQKFPTPQPAKFFATFPGTKNISGGEQQPDA